MWNPPTAKQLAKIPKLYSTENVPMQEKKIYVHFFLGSWDWYVAEFDGQDTFFGLVSGHEREWGYFSLSELKAIKKGFLEVDNDNSYKAKPKKLKDVIFLR